MKIIKDYQRLSRIIEDYQRLSEIIEDYLRLSRIIKDYQGLLKIIDDYQGLSKIEQLLFCDENIRQSMVIDKCGWFMGIYAITSNFKFGCNVSN